MDQKYEALFTPWKIGNVEIKNRIVLCPMGGTSLFGWFELDNQEELLQLCRSVDTNPYSVNPTLQETTAHYDSAFF